MNRSLSNGMGTKALKGRLQYRTACGVCKIKSHSNRTKVKERNATVLAAAAVTLSSPDVKAKL